MPYGCLVCIECSGIHRSLGVHISKVRSLSLDTWTPEMAHAVGALGNEAANSVLLAAPLAVDASDGAGGADGAAAAAAPSPPSASSSRAEKEEWIRHKYLLKSGIRHDVAPADLPSALCDAARRDDAVALLALLLQVDTVGGALDAPEPSTGELPVHAAAAADAPRSLELLLLAGASLEASSSSGRTAAHVAAAHGAERCLTLLVRRGADAAALDASGASPLALATEGEHDGCVAILTTGADLSEDRARQRESIRDEFEPGPSGRSSRNGSFSRQGSLGSAAPLATLAGGTRSTRHSRTGSGGGISAQVIDTLVSSLDGMGTVPTPGSSAYTSPAEESGPAPSGTGGAPSSGRRGLRIALKPRKLMSLALGSRSHADRTPRRDLAELSDDDLRAAVPPPDYALPLTDERPATRPRSNRGRRWPPPFANMGCRWSGACHQSTWRDLTRVPRPADITFAITLGS